MQPAALVLGISRTLTDSFEEVVRRHEAPVLRAAFRILGNQADAEDVAQESFIRLHRHGLRFGSDAALAAWLYRVSVNLCLDRLRSGRDNCEVAEVAAPEASAETLLLREEQKRQLSDALSRLPAKERAAVVLREIEGLSTAEVAQVLGSTEGTVRSQVSTGFARLRELLGRRPL